MSRSLVPAATAVSRACSPLRALDRIAEGGSTEVAGFVEDVLQTLNDLIEYFKQPDSELEHEEKQCLLRSLIKRQDLFKEEVRLTSVGACSLTITLKLVSECGRNMGTGMHSVDICVYGVFSSCILLLMGIK